MRQLQPHYANSLVRSQGLGWMHTHSNASWGTQPECRIDEACGLCGVSFFLPYFTLLFHTRLPSLLRMLIDWSCYRYAPLCDVRRSMGCECGRVPGGKTSWKNLAAKPKAAWEEVNDVSIFTTQFGCGVGEERSSSNSSTMSWSKFVLRPAIRTDIFCFITIISLQLVSWEDHCTVLGWLLDSTLQLNIPKLTA